MMIRRTSERMPSAPTMKSPSAEVPSAKRAAMGWSGMSDADEALVVVEWRRPGLSACSTMARWRAARVIMTEGWP